MERPTRETALMLPVRRKVRGSETISHSSVFVFFSSVESSSGGERADTKGVHMSM